MDQNLQDFNSKKNTIEKEIATILLDSAESKKISLQEIQPIAKEILADFKKINDEAQLFIFLEKIKNKWDFFSNLYTRYKGNIQQEKEKHVIEKLSKYINQTN